MKYFIASINSNGQYKAFAKFRGKPAKEVYRCCKGIIISRSFKGPITYAAGQIGKEFTNGVVANAGGSIVEGMIGYISGVGFVRWIYKATDVGRIHTYSRLVYNIVGLPLTIYSKGISAVTDTIGLSWLEEKWFGQPIYLFDDNRLLLEKNFTLTDVFKMGDENGE